MLEYLIRMHSRLLVTILLVFIILTLWGLVNHLRRTPPSRTYMSVLIIGELLMVTQFIIGVLLLFNGRQAYLLGLHILYGFVAVFAIPAVYLYVRDRSRDWDHLIYAITSAFICGIAIRALETGRIPTLEP
ncbi:MAG: hypothetical protein GFH27_549333n76 [Chloroflexi bacterium AL-W]|nr:hypothetical protein [Chloroflexi bacterium AL-N1]NOK70471.1 hypothetical protein [Chloroflexi bacterium AL-N10]NOK78170.1 hypothetical protein [Chloroflexi bacterium AL-N5]NOK85269.1 hypothetical protein [Chloroflexi bacterium AL-W]NOK92034.1 hypothetical protein [Chloroflexi bacterium AL-N15]